MHYILLTECGLFIVWLLKYTTIIFQHSTNRFSFIKDMKNYLGIPMKEQGKPTA
jgi:hypothetical protein